MKQYLYFVTIESVQKTVTVCSARTKQFPNEKNHYPCENRRAFGHFVEMQPGYPVAFGVRCMNVPNVNYQIGSTPLNTDLPFILGKEDVCWLSARFHISLLIFSVFRHYHRPPCGGVNLNQPIWCCCGSVILPVGSCLPAFVTWVSLLWTAA